MAADILLYQADLVPIGDDQRQHMELTRDVAERFNGIYGDVFTVPEPYFGKTGARIMSLQDPSKKMSKSETENKNNVIYLLDEPDVIMAKFKRAVTDSGSEVIYSDDKPGIKNLLDIYCALTGIATAEAEREFDGKGYGFFKSAVGETVVAELRPVWERFNELKQNKDYVDGIIASGARNAGALAARTLAKVQKKIGLPR
jgi:tryptophanyl-tRNA synthetase